MGLKDRILFEVHGNIKKINTQEDERKRLVSFFEGFMVDAKELGLEEATEIYGSLFGKEVKSGLVDLKEDFETVLNDSINEAGLSGERVAGMLSMIRSQGARGLSAERAAGAMKMQQKAGTLADVAAGASANAPKTGLAALWDNIKNFFTGGWTAITTAFKTGNFSALLSTPLIQGALATGGIVLAFKLLKKIFGRAGKTMTAEQQKKIQAELQAKLDAKKAENEAKNKEKI